MIPVRVMDGHVEIELESVACNFCGSERKSSLYRKPDLRTGRCPGHAFQIVRCDECGLAYLDPRPTFGSMQHFYPPEYFADRDSSKKTQQYRDELALLPDAPARLLDVGCANGDFAHLAQSEGYEVEGLEIASASVNRHGLTIHASWDPVESGSFDIVTAWAVLEHLHDPSTYFEQVARVLKPGGVFVFLVPNFASPVNQLMKKEDVPRHLYFFTPDSAKNFVERAGMTFVRTMPDTKVYSAGQKGLLKYYALRAIGREFQPWHRENPLRLWKAGKIPFLEYLYLLPFEHIERPLRGRLDSFYAQRDRHGSMVCFAASPKPEN